MAPKVKAAESCEVQVKRLSPSACTWQRRLLNFFVIAGPGYMAMLADTDVGSIVTAAQSGAQWGYRLLWVQLIFIPILYWVQELTVRLGLSTGKGQGRLIREHFGPTWARITAVVLFISVLGALVTEFVGIAGVGLLFHISPRYTVGLAVIFLLGIVLTGSYRRLELIGIAVGLFEISLVAAAYLARPEMSEIKNQFFSIRVLPLGYRHRIGLRAGHHDCRAGIDRCDHRQGQPERAAEQRRADSGCHYTADGGDRRKGPLCGRHYERCPYRGNRGLHGRGMGGRRSHRHEDEL
jgi:hypothetical protein